MSDPIEMAVRTDGSTITLEVAMVYVCRRGIPPHESRHVARQVLACYHAGIAPTFAKTYEAWKRINHPKELRDRIVGVAHA